jgi:hypothetical protein
MGQGIPDAGFKAIAGLGFMQPKPGAPDNPFVELGVNRYLIDLPRSEGVTGRIILDPSAEDTKDFVELPNANAYEIFGTAAPPDTVPGCLGPLVDGCSSRALAAPRRGGVLKAAFSADPAGFDPVRGPSGMSHVVIEQAMRSATMACNIRSSCAPASPSTTATNSRRKTSSSRSTGSAPTRPSTRSMSSTSSRSFSS